MKKDNKQDTRETILATAGGGMGVALATVLSLITLYRMPQGGEVTPAAMLPIIFCALAFGPVWGMGYGMVYGVLQFLLAPFLTHWASFIMDYPLAFGLLGLSGLFAAPKAQRLSEERILHRLNPVPLPRLLLAVWVAIGARWLTHVLSGVLFFRAYALEAGLNPWLYSVIYNSSYLVPEAVLTSALLLPLVFLTRKRATRTGRGG